MRYPLRIANVYGGWTTHVPGLQGSTYYRLTARARPVNVTSIRESVTILLRWRGSFGDEEQPDYVWNFEKQQDGSILFNHTLQAPAGTTRSTSSSCCSGLPADRSHSTS